MDSLQNRNFIDINK